MSIHVLIPAHQEERQIGAAITSLREQSLPPDHIVVIADNCTDATAEVAGAHGAEVVETVGNTHKKAGALNQVLDRMLADPGLGDDDAILVLDADSELESAFLANAMDHFAADRDLAAVGGTFSGKDGGGLVGMFQRNEYARYARDVRRLDGRALVLTGTATVFRVSTLRRVVAARAAGDLPGAAHVYDVRVLTEDNELTLAILHLGMGILAPAGCLLRTEVMETWGALFRQRLRWKRGALENLADYGWTAVTRRYWGRQLLSAIGIVVIAAYLGSIAFSFVTTGGVQLHPLWLAVTVVFVVERVVSVRARGPVQMALAATLVVEMVFDVFLQAAQATAFAQAAVGSERKW